MKKNNQLSGDFKKDKENFYRFIQENGLRHEANLILSHVINSMKKTKINAKKPKKQKSIKSIPKTINQPINLSQQQMAEGLRDIKKRLKVSET